ncbi:hypothetical protein TRFO_40301 [Tritrichomonas foetus]|uniref:RCC1-like domain-containing protein n=1 Tax=Tritrichomonas foetus TaxID=1144522 RepID=A0A1J4J829_9EUKA|nr:hypothetical protein TRFO_40301 [Tritrichomonas foetus]|eukprot:OHS93380.1 hypothetical protein TRFO_40301 [Tritrichomonas foetus]
MSKSKKMENMQIVSAGGEHHSELGRGEYYIPLPIDKLPTKNLSCISTGCAHSVALYKDGSVFGWGYNYNGCLGFPEEVEDVKFPTKINGLPKIIDVKCGFRFTLFLTEEKKVLIASTYNEKGLFEEITIREPTVALFGIYDPWIVGESGTIYWHDYEKTKRIKQFGPFPFGIPKQIVSIEHSALLLTKKGETYGMSMKKLRPNDFDQDPDFVFSNENMFSLIESLRDVKIIKISGFGYQFLALSEDNKVFAWGNNKYGQLAVGDKKDRYDSFVLSTVSGDAKIVDIAAGGYHSILVDSTGHVWGFGSGGYGETMLGDYHREGPLSKVVEGAVSAYCGDFCSFVLIGNQPLPEAGTLNSISYSISLCEERNIFSAGSTTNYQIGRVNDHIPLPIDKLPTKNLSCISAGDLQSVALYKDGSVFGWGKNFNGHLGFPKEVEDVKFPIKINGLPKIIDVKCGSRFILFLTEEKKVLIASECNKKCLFEAINIREPAVALFGFYDPWIVGENGTIYWYDFRETNRIEKFGPFPFGIPKQIVSLEYSVLLLTKKGETYGMSMKKLRPHGDFDRKVVCKNEDYFSLIESLRDVKIIKISGNFNHFLALSEDNKVFAWGRNDDGQLGVGDKKDRYGCFVLSTVSGNSKIVDIAAGEYHSILVDSTGHVWGIGYGEYGQTMLGEYKEKGPLSKVVEGAVSAYCGNAFSLVLIGDQPLPEAGTLNLICKKREVKHSKHKQSKHHSKHSLKIDNKHLKEELLIKNQRIDELEKELLELRKKIRI